MWGPSAVVRLVRDTGMWVHSISEVAKKERIPKCDWLLLWLWTYDYRGGVDFMCFFMSERSKCTCHLLCWRVFKVSLYTGVLWPFSSCIFVFLLFLKRKTLIYSNLCELENRKKVLLFWEQKIIFKSWLFFFFFLFFSLWNLSNCYGRLVLYTTTGGQCYQLSCTCWFRCLVYSLVVVPLSF